MELINVCFRTFFFYFLVVIAYRIMGKREIAQLEVIDLIVSILIAELIAISIENINDSIILTIFPIILLVILEVILAKISIKSRKFNKIMSGSPSLIISNGKIRIKSLIKNRYTLDDLLLSLRQQGIKNIKEVEYAFLETNGKLSVFKYNIMKFKTDYPMPIVIDGELQINTLNELKRTKDWYINIINKNGIQLKKVLYSFYKNNKIHIIIK